MLRRGRLLCLIIVCACSASIASDDDVADKAVIDPAMLAKLAASHGGQGDEDEKSPYPKFEEVTKGMESKEGLFTLWSYPTGAKDKDTEKLLCQIPAGFLGEKFMLSVSFSGGGFFTGFPLEEDVVKWEILDKQLLLIEPETAYVVDASKTVSDVVERTYPERIRAAVPIVTKAPGGDPVIDLGGMLKSNFADIAWMSGGGLFGFGGGGINPGLSKWTTKKSFELNVEIGVSLAMSRSSPPGSYDKKMVHFSFWKLPKSNYTPRAADDRVGYFLTANQDWAKPTDSRDLFNRYIDRWQLEKRDPSLAVCEPKQPIVYYIEKTVPIQFRRAVRDGILEWNKAFEKIGFVNAVEVRQQTDDNEWKDLDPEDMRYSFFRWIVTGGGFAMGPHRANPFTGEIYDADIVFDDSMVRYYQQSAVQNLPSTALAAKMSDPVLHEFFQENPQWRRPTRAWEGIVDSKKEEETQLRQRMRERMGRRGHFACDYAEGMKHQLAVAQAMMAGQPKEVIDRLLYDCIKEVVMHEVGHTLGLRHNFKASTIHSVEEIKELRGTGKPLVGSVMDYNPVLFFKDQSTEGHFITPTIGPYDEWAIEYGYRPADGTYKSGPKDEAEQGDKTEPEKQAAADPDESSDNTSDIPNEVLEKLPEDVQKMIQARNKKMGGNTGPHVKKPSGPAFAGPNSAEQTMLNAIASRSAEPQFAYATDEDTTALSPDPRSNRFDMGSNPIDWAKERMQLVNERMKSLLDWSVKENESWYFIRSSFQSLLVDKAFILDYVGRYIGGQYTSRAHRGDSNAPPPFVLVDAKTQRDALAFIEENLYSDDFFSFPPDLLNHLTVPRWYHDGAWVNFVVDYPIHNLISTLQWWNLFDRLFPNTLRRIYDAEMKTTDANKLTVAEYIQRIQASCWSKVLDTNAVGKKKWTDANPFLSSTRRSLQREYLSLMELLVRTRPGVLVPPDVHAMLCYALRKLDKSMEKAIDAGKLDFATESHFVACRSRIKRMLEPNLDEF